MQLRRTLATIREFRIEGATAHTWLNTTMDELELIVSEIEARGGAAGRKA
jgi:hypothetical protein